MATTKFKREKSTTTKGHYVTNAQLLEEIAACKENNQTLSPELARMLLMIATRYSLKPNFVNYSYREDMVAEAVLHLCAIWHKFNPERSSNPFAFFTTSITRSFLHRLSEEKKHRNIRDALLVDAGANPSFSFQGRGSKGAKTSDDPGRSGSDD